MRAFISIDMSKEVKKEILRIQKNLPKFYGKKTEPENLHLTLKFLGEIDNRKIEMVKEKLREIKFNKFYCEIDKIGVFSPKFIKIVWLHLTNCEGLQKEIDSALESLFEKEKRFMSHLTIARVKSIKDKRKFLENLKKIKIPKIKFIADNFRLKKSTLTEKGPIYKILETFELD